MSRHKQISHIYNPDNQTKEALLQNFVVRLSTFDKLFRAIKKSKMETPEQHYIIQGQRGAGKTTLLLKLAYEIENDPELSAWLIPVRLNEEQYNIFSLCRLWETVADYLEDHADFEGISDSLESAREAEDYPEICFKILEKQLQQKGKKILLLFDNIADFLEKLSPKEGKRLRDLLHKTTAIRIVGASAKTLEKYFRHDKPFFEFFKTIYLEGLNFGETEKLLLQLAKSYDEPKVKEIVENQKSRVEALRRLTGGIPRTIILLFEILVDQSANVFEDLELILDRITPLYKHRMDDLSGQQQAIVDAIALHWDAVGANEIAKQVRLETKAVSAQLKQLEKNNFIRSELADRKNKLYFIAERFFNIWYLMRYGRKRHRENVLWLVRFLQDWCSPDELKERATNHMRLAKAGELHVRGAVYMCEALAQCLPDESMQHALIADTRDFLEKTSPVLAKNLSPSDRDLFAVATELYESKKYQEALKKLQQIRMQDATIWYHMALIYRKIKDFTSAEHYYKLAADQGDTNAMGSLALLCKNEKKDLVQAEHYYKLAADQGNVSAMFNLALLYKNEKMDLAQAEHYYKLAADQGNTKAMINLTVLYLTEKNDTDQACHYFKLAVDQGDPNAMNGMAWLYFEQNINKDEALDLATRSVNAHPDKFNTNTLAAILLWNNQYTESVETFRRFLAYEPYDKLHQDIVMYLVLLLAKKQHHLLLNLFSEKEFQLKDRYKPIYFALMHRLRDEYPKEAKKMGEELDETVKEILAEAEKMAKTYA